MAGTDTPERDDRLVVVAGDAHGNAHFVAAAIRHAVEVGANRVVQVGDFGIWPGESGIEFLYWVERCATKYDVVVEFIDGNHDDHDALAWYAANGERTDDGGVIIRPGVVWRTRGSVVTWAGRRIGFLGGAVSVDRNRRVLRRSWWPEEVVGDDDVDRLITNAGGDGLEVVFTHDSPHGLAIPAFSGWPADALYDSDLVRRRVSRALAATGARLSIHGHWHVRYRWTGTYDLPELAVEGLGAEGPDGIAVLDLEHLCVLGDAPRLDQLRG